jgi:hypothetical protein
LFSETEIEDPSIQIPQIDFGVEYEKSGLAEKINEDLRKYKPDASSVSFHETLH